MISLFTPIPADEDNTNAQVLAVKNIVAHLDPDIFHVTLFSKGLVDPRIETRKNVTFIPWGQKHNTLRTLKHLLNYPPDIFFYPQKGYIEYAFLLLNSFNFSKKTKIVTHVVHEINQSDKITTDFAAKVFRKTLKKSAIIASNNTLVTQNLKKVFNIEALTIYDIIDARYFYGENLSTPSKLTVLYAGSFQEKKRPEVIIEFAKKFPEINFKLAGKGPKESSCQQLKNTYGCHNVTFLGLLPPSELGQQMRQADIFLFPSISEGHPQVLGQAAASGLPVIAMQCYQPDFVVHKKTGFLADNDGELYYYFERLISDPQLRAQFSKNSLTHMQQFSTQKIITQWSDVFT